MGLKMLDQVSHEIDASASSLVFTNTRAGRTLVSGPARSPPRLGRADRLHHASLARETRDWVERSSSRAA
jgi:ATP-dependent Lhr-like helicase